MHRPPRLFWIIWTLLLLADLLGVLYMIFFVGVMKIPLAELPPAFWALLIGMPLSFIFPVLYWGRHSTVPTQPNKQMIISFIISGALFLTMAFLNNLLTPHFGGTTAIFAVVGTSNLLFALISSKGGKMRWYRKPKSTSDDRIP